MEYFILNDSCGSFSISYKVVLFVKGAMRALLACGGLVADKTPPYNHLLSGKSRELQLVKNIENPNKGQRTCAICVYIYIYIWIILRKT